VKLIKTKYPSVYSYISTKGVKSYYISYKKNGKSKRQKSNAKTALEAHKELISIREQKEDDNILNRFEEHIEFEDVFLHFYDVKQYSKKTISGDKGYFYNHIKPYFKKDNLLYLRHYDIPKFFNYLKGKGMSDGTVIQVYSTARAAINLAIKDELLPRYFQNPFHLCDWPKKPQPRKASLSMDELYDFLNYLKENQKTEYDIWAMASFLAFTGCRFSEMAQCKWHDIDLEKREIFLKGLKDSHNRYIGIPDYLYDVLINIKRSNKTDLVFYRVDKKGNLVKFEQMPKSFMRYTNKYFPDNKKKDNTNRFVVHSFRTTHAVLLGNETSLEIAQAQLGHKSIAMTSRYFTSSDKKRKRETARVFNR
jgi:integrase